jgi:hypothetical protein
MDTTKPVLIDGGSITPRRTSRYLGLTMGEELKWNIHIHEIKTKATKSIRALASLAGSTWGISLKDMRRIYQATIVPQILSEVQTSHRQPSAAQLPALCTGA